MTSPIPLHWVCWTGLDNDRTESEEIARTGRAFLGAIFQTITQPSSLLFREHTVCPTISRYCGAPIPPQQSFSRSWNSYWVSRSVWSRNCIRNLDRLLYHLVDALLRAVAFQEQLTISLGFVVTMISGQATIGLNYCTQGFQRRPCNSLVCRLAINPTETHATA
jgi:hypothetical protein